MSAVRKLLCIFEEKEKVIKSKVQVLTIRPGAKAEDVYQLLGGICASGKYIGPEVALEFAIEN